MKSKWIKQGDNVLVIAGNDKGKMGKVLAKTKEKVLVQNVNIRKKHAKKRRENQPSEIIDIELPIHISNVTLCDKEGHPLTLKVRKTKEGVEELCYMKEDKEVVYRKK